MASLYRLDNVNLEYFRRNHAFKRGKIDVHIEKIVKEGTEDRIKQDYILRPFQDVASVLPV